MLLILLPIVVIVVLFGKLDRLEQRMLDLEMRYRDLDDLKWRQVDQARHGVYYDPQLAARMAPSQVLPTSVGPPSPPLSEQAAPRPGVSASAAAETPEPGVPAPEEATPQLPGPPEPVEHAPAPPVPAPWVIPPRRAVPLGSAAGGPERASAPPAGPAEPVPLFASAAQVEQGGQSPGGVRPGAVPPGYVAPASRSRQEWESFIGGKVLNRIGALAVVIGMGFFLKYAFDNGWVSRTLQVLIGGLIGVGLLALGQRFKRKDMAIFAQGLAGAGISVLYLSIYAAFNFYGLISQALALLLMSSVTAIAFAQALSLRLAGGGAAGLGRRLPHAAYAEHRHSQRAGAL